MQKRNRSISQELENSKTTQVKSNTIKLNVQKSKNTKVKALRKQQSPRIKTAKIFKASMIQN